MLLVSQPQRARVVMYQEGFEPGLKRSRLVPDTNPSSSMLPVYTPTVSLIQVMMNFTRRGVKLVKLTSVETVCSSPLL